MQVDEHQDEKQLSGEQLPPIIGTSHPELTVSDERLALDDANYGEHPGKWNEDNEHAGPEFRVEESADEGRRPGSGNAGMRPAVGHIAAVGDHQGQGHGDFSPEMSDIFEENVDDQFHDFAPAPSMPLVSAPFLVLATLVVLSSLVASASSRPAFAMAKKMERRDMGVNVTSRVSPRTLRIC